MCQRIEDGGRRCPKHQHICKAILAGVQAETNLERVQVESLFTKLRSEGLHTALPEDSTVIQTVTHKIIDNLIGEQGQSRRPSVLMMEEQKQKSTENDEHTQIDGGTYYALQTIRERAKTQAKNIDLFIQGISTKTGLDKAHIFGLYLEHMENTDITRSAKASPEYTPENRKKAAQEGLPYDRASVVAIEKLKALPIKRNRNIKHINVNNSHIKSHGYDNGRLEIVLRGKEDSTLTYTGVPQNLYDKLITAPNMNQVFTSIRNDPQYRYSTNEEALDNGNIYRCSGCGQFSARTGHSCPVRENKNNTMQEAALDNQGRLHIPEKYLNRTEITVVQEKNAADDISYLEEQRYKFTNPVETVAENSKQQLNTTSEEVAVFDRGSGATRSSLYNVPAIDRLEELPATEEITKENVKAYKTYYMGRGFASEGVLLPGSLDGLDTLLQYADVEIPISIFSSPAVPDENTPSPLTNICTVGTVTIKQLENNKEEYIADDRLSRLRCDCIEYRERYFHCVHTRRALENVNTLFRLHSTQIRENYIAPNPLLQIDNKPVAITLSNTLAGIDLEEEPIPLDHINEVRRDAYLKYIDRSVWTKNRETMESSTIYRDKMLQRWETVEPGYTENPTKFYEDYKETLKKKRQKSSVIPFLTENVTDGICAPGEGTRSFGVELEFDFPKTFSPAQKKECLEKIGEELEKAKLTSSPHQKEYHSASFSGWKEWSFEVDSTVAGEIVSPLMKDTPEHWKQLRLVCEIIKRNGGIASQKTGSHVHISTSSYENNTAKYAELLRQGMEHQETLYRLGTNPQKGKHRGTRWCKPNNDHTLTEEVSDNQNDHTNQYYAASHSEAINYESTTNSTYSKSHTEFRMWDGTLDPAIIQQQIVVSAAMTDMAERTILQEKTSKRRPSISQKKLGDMKAEETKILNKRLLLGRTHTKETLIESSEPAIRFIDALFRKQEDRKRVAALFAITKWMKI